MIDSIHQSTLNMAFRCGEQFRRRYILGHIVPPSVPAGRGTGVHKANEANLRQKVESREDMPLADLQDAARDGYVHALQHGVYLPKDKVSEKNRLLNDGLNDTLRLTKLYRNAVAPNINPIHVEREFSINVGLPLLLEGRMDYQEKPIVGDLKTAGKSWGEHQIHKEIQPVFYSFVHEHETGIRPKFIYHILVALKTKEKLQTQDLTPTDRHYQALYAKLLMFCKMLETETFLPANPSSWWCDPRYCGYYYTCPFVGNELPKAWI